MAEGKVRINRAPVMTLWAAVVAERLGFDHEASLTLAKVVTGLNAQAKGQRLGIYEPAPIEERLRRMREQPTGAEFTVELMGRAIPVMNTPEGMRATQDGKPVSPAAVERYLAGKYGDNLAAVQAAMAQLAASFSEQELADHAYRLYEKFRPSVPPGVTGWGAAGELDLGVVTSLARRA